MGYSDRTDPSPKSLFYKAKRDREERAGKVRRVQIASAAKMRRLLTPDEVIQGFLTPGGSSSFSEDQNPKANP